MKLIDAPVGLFLYKGTLCLKTEYMIGESPSTPDCFTIDGGECFWGDAKTYAERNNLDVTPIFRKKENAQPNRCRFLSDDFDERCVNAECPVVADFCPCGEYQEICKYAEVDNGRGGK